MQIANRYGRWGVYAAVAALILIGAVLLTATFDSAGRGGTVLITGANRGIGLALAREYAGRGWKVIATARRPDDAAELKALAAGGADLSIEKLDVTHDADIAALAARLRDVPIDVLLNNAGSNAGGRGQVFGELDYAVLDELMAVNLAGPLKMAEAFLPNVLASRQKKIVVVSSIQGSITRTFGGSYSYRASKAALNMVMRTLAKDLEKQGVIVGILSPGIVLNERNKDLDIPKITAEESARALATVIEELTPAQSGEFLEYDGTTLPW
jgi:NAD(P)-dependent dehydrogenase (short-subunit alcohol dehydrogenase family)